MLNRYSLCLGTCTLDNLKDLHAYFVDVSNINGAHRHDTFIIIIILANEIDYWETNPKQIHVGPFYKFG